MPKVKMARKSTAIDMTAMCDVAFLLLSFFMLVTQFKKPEPVVVVTPSSISQIQIPDTAIVLITVDKKDRIFFDIDRRTVAARGGNDSRRGVIDDLNEFKNLGLTEAQKKTYVIGSSIGVPFSQLSSYLAADPSQAPALDASATGIPTDTTNGGINNELATWIKVARNNNPYVRILIKADGETSYPTIDRVIKTLGDLKIFKFNLVTNLEAVPEGTAAYENLRTDKKKG